MSPRKKLFAAVGAGAIALSALTACASSDAEASGSADEANPSVIKFGVPPGEADPAMMDEMQPMADLVGEATGTEVEVTKTSDYLGIVEAMRSGLLDVAMFSPMPTVIAKDVGKIDPLVVALGAPYATNIICSKSSGVTELPQVQDHSIAFVDPGSTSGNYIPRLMLKEAGVDVDNLDETYAGGHDVAAMAVKQGSTDCAAVATMIIAELEESGTVTSADYNIIAESEPLPISMVIIARDGLSEEYKSQITEAFLENQSEEILGAVGAKELVAAEDADWSLFEKAAEDLGVELDDVE